MVQTGQNYVKLQKKKLNYFYFGNLRTQTSLKCLLITIPEKKRANEYGI